MQTARIQEEGKPAYEAKIEDFDPANEKGSFEATQFNGKTLSVPKSLFTLTVDGQTYRCRTLVATHFVVIKEAENVSNKAATASR